MTFDSKIIKIFFSLTIATAITIYCVQNPAVFVYVKQFQISTILYIFSLHILFHLFNAFILIELIRPHLSQNCPIDLKLLFKIYGIVHVSSLANYLVPFRMGGIGVKALYLKKYFCIDVSHTVSIFLVSSLTLISICTVLVYVFLTSIENINLPYKEGIDYILLIGSSVLIIFWLYSGVFRGRNLSTHSSTHLLRKLLQGLNLISLQSHISISIMFILQIIIGTFVTLLLLSAVNQSVSLNYCIILTAVGQLSMLVSITPGNIGVKELTITGIGGIFGIEPEALLGALMVDRILLLALTCLSSAYYIYGGHLELDQYKDN